MPSQRFHIIFNIKNKFNAKYAKELLQKQLLKGRFNRF